MNPETKIQNKIMDYLKSQSILVWRISDNFIMAGFPDLLVCYRGMFVALEVKTETGVPTKQQEMIMDYINKAEGCAKVVRSVEDVKKVLYDINLIMVGWE